MTNATHILPSRALLPAEIISLIISNLPSVCDFSSERHAQLSSLCLVCRHWCNGVRPALWKKLALRSRKDLLELVAIVSRPGCIVGGYIRSITLESQEMRPWISAAIALLSALTVTRLPDLNVMTWEEKSKTVAALPPALSVYASGFRVMTSLSLTGFKFISLRLLTRFVSSLPLLESLRCERVEWKTPPATWNPPRQTTLNPRLSRVYARRCTAPCNLLWLFWIPSPGANMSKKGVTAVRARDSRAKSADGSRHIRKSWTISRMTLHLTCNNQ